MKKYRLWQKVAAVFLAAYFVIGFASYGLPNKELFPIFSWLLFAATPGERTGYALRIQSVGDKEFGEEGIRHTDAFFFMLNASGVSAHHQIQRLGQAIEAGDESGIARHREVVEGMFSTTPVEYKVIREVFDPLERWKTGTIEVTPLRDFAIEGPAATPPTAREAE